MDSYPILCIKQTDGENCNVFNVIVMPFSVLRAHEIFQLLAELERYFGLDRKKHESFNASVSQ